MDKKTYYVDSHAGDDGRDGLDASQPIRTCRNLHLLPGDTVLFKRGSVIRGGIEACDGSELGVITYGSYGTGNKPVFMGSAPVNSEEEWREERPSVWRFQGVFPSEVCNLIFDGGEGCGHLRWQLEDLKHQGEWHYTQWGQNSDKNVSDKSKREAEGALYLFSSINPGLFYKSIECALWGGRKMIGGKQYIVFENLIFANSGVHGYQESHAHHITIRNCEFKFIGGAVWSKELKIRFGNAVELWDGAQDVVVERCIFSNIYDSGVTHQGSNQSDTPERIYFRNNLFMDCGMAAYECRGPSVRAVYFEHNTCINAGGGFSLQGEVPPRQSEIYPQPMGHHVFIWRMEKPIQKESVFIRNNVFYEAPLGASLYSMIDSADEQNLVIDENTYCQTAGNLLVRMSGRIYGMDQFSLYQMETGHDKNSIAADPYIIENIGASGSNSEQ